MLEKLGKQQTKQEKLSQLQDMVNNLKKDILNLHRTASFVSDTSKAEKQVEIEDQISLMKQELFQYVAQTKQQLNSRTLQEKVFDEVNVINDELLKNQREFNSQLSIKVSENQFQDKELKSYEQQLSSEKKQDLLLQQQLDKQQININFLQKQILSEQQQLKTLEPQYQELFKKYQAKLNEERSQLQQRQQSMDQIEIELNNFKEKFQKEKQIMNERVEERYSDSKISSSADVFKQNQQIQDTIDLLMLAINDKNQACNNLKDIHKILDAEIKNDQIEKMQINKQDLLERVKDKNDLMETKDMKNVDVLNSIEQFNIVIGSVSNKIQVHENFKESYENIKQREKELATEIEALRKFKENFNEQTENTKSSLSTIKDKIKTLDYSLDHEQIIIEQQQNTEQQRLVEILNIKTQNYLENQLRDKISIIRDLEATLRRKDHEIDTFELKNSQKDTVIIDLEEQAGKFKEVVKEVLYESTKNDKVDKALLKYQESHTIRIEMKKLGDGYYKFGSKRVYLKLDIDQQSLLVRTGPKEYISLSRFIIENEHLELKKIGGTKSFQSSPTNKRYQ